MLLPRFLRGTRRRGGQTLPQRRRRFTDLPRGARRAALCQGPVIFVARIAYFLACVVAGLVAAYTAELRRRQGLLLAVGLRRARHAVRQSRREASAAAVAATDSQESLSRYEASIAYICHEVRAVPRARRRLVPDAWLCPLTHRAKLFRAAHVIICRTRGVI
jgi:hypothetical protein